MFESGNFVGVAGNYGQQTVRLRVMGTVSAIALTALAAVPAFAQSSPTPAPPAATNTAPSTGEIVVTALRRSQSVLKVPAAISVIGGGDLKTDGVNSVNDLQNLVPGVVIGTGGFGTNISIRGVTSTDQTSKGELGIAYNVDGAFVGRGQEQGLSYFDIERVEVLRGPQGTLYGRSSTGGAINVITAKPKLDQVSGYAKIEYGNYNAKRAEGAFNLPLSDTLAIRVAGNFNNRDGYLTPQGFSTVFNGTTYTVPALGQPAKNDQVDSTGRFSVLYKPTPDLTATVVATVGHLGGVGPGTATLYNLENQTGGAKLNVVANPVPAFQDSNFFNLVGTLNFKFGGVQLDLLGSQQHFTDHTQVTGTNNPVDNLDGFDNAPSFTLDDYHGVFNTTQFEARVSNVSEGTIDYVAGANYYHEHIHESDHNWNAPIDTYADSSTWLNGIDPLNTTTHKSYGVFGQITFHATSQLSVIGGARYTHDATQRVGTFAVPFFNPATGGPWLDPSGNPCVYPNDCVGNPNNGIESDSKVTWRVGVNYQLTPRDLLYASIATGFKAGGFNDFDPSTGSTGAYGPESLTAYEVGYKGKPLAGLTFSSSLYYYDYSKDQINSLVFFGHNGVLFTQLAPVQIYGWENEISYQVDRNTSLSGTASYQHSKIKSLMEGPTYPYTDDFSGRPLDRTPSFVATGVFVHSFDLANGAQIKFRGAGKYSSSYYLSDYSHAVQYKQKAFTRSDASLTYAAAGDRYTLQLFVENIENKIQKTSGPNGYNGSGPGSLNGTLANGYTPAIEGSNPAFPINSTTFGVAPPRFYGVRLGAKF